MGYVWCGTLGGEPRLLWRVHGIVGARGHIARREDSTALVRAETGSLLLPGPVVPEVDHLLGARLGREAQAFEAVKRFDFG